MSYYRNVDANWRLIKDIPDETMSMPILFITGSRDPVYTSPWSDAVAGVQPGTDIVDAMTQVLPDFRGAVFIDGSGHWNRQEKANDTNAAGCAWLVSASTVSAATSQIPSGSSSSAPTWSKPAPG
jgi:hypothetical protein